MNDAFICDGVRTPIGRYGGALSSVRPDDLAAVPLRALMERTSQVDWARLDDVILGCANQAGEDNRNVARMAVLLSGLPEVVPGATVNRLCGSGLDAIAQAARLVKCGEADLVIAGGVESMSRAPFVMGKAEGAFSRKAEIYDTTIGWRFVNKLMEKHYGVDSMPETAENVATDFQISREDQDQFAWRSQQKAGAAQEAGIFDDEIIPVRVRVSRQQEKDITRDEHPRPETKLEKLSSLPTPFKAGGTITAGNASGVNDGACAMIVASEKAVKEYDLNVRARFVGSAVHGVPPRIMGVGPVPATKKLLGQAGLNINDMNVIELNEAFAAQSLAVMRALGLADDAPHVNPHGGAIALGHPLGMSGARLALTACLELKRRQGRYALCTMCIGVGQGIAAIFERV